MRWNLMTIYWLVVWFALGFGVPETIALATGHPENTLSEQVWHIEGLGNRVPFWEPWHWTPAHWAIFIGMVWLSGHFDFHIWR